MPLRFLKPGLLLSERWNRCGWHGQSFYIRLVMLVDDFGRYEAGPRLLRHFAFPLHEDIRTSQVQELCAELQATQLAIFYKVDGTEYLQLLRWTERVRAKKSYYPGPCGDKACAHLLSSDNICAPPRPASSPPSPTPPASPSASEPPAPDSSCWPTLAEWKEAAKIEGLVEWKAVEEWHYQEKLDPPWRGVGAWRKHLSHTRVKWEQAGRPMNPPTTKDYANRNIGQQRPDRNAGTTNEGTAAEYRGLGKVAKA